MRRRVILQVLEAFESSTIERKQQLMLVLPFSGRTKSKTNILQYVSMAWRFGFVSLPTCILIVWALVLTAHVDNLKFSSFSPFVFAPFYPLRRDVISYWPFSLQFPRCINSTCFKRYFSYLFRIPFSWDYKWQKGKTYMNKVISNAHFAKNEEGQERNVRRKLKIKRNAYKEIKCKWQ